MKYRLAFLSLLLAVTFGLLATRSQAPQSRPHTQDGPASAVSPPTTPEKVGQSTAHSDASSLGERLMTGGEHLPSRPSSRGR